MSTTQPMTRTARVAVRAGVPVSLLASAALSFHGQAGLAQLIGWERQYAWLLPTAVIVYEAVATVVWFGIASELRDERKRAAWNALLAVLVSLGLNSTWHVLHPGTAPLLVTLVVSAIPNIVLAALLHMSMTLPTGVPVPEEAQREAAVPEPRPEVEPSPRPGSVPAAVATRVVPETVLPAVPTPRPSRGQSRRSSSGTGRTIPEATLKLVERYLEEVAGSGRNPSTVRAPELVEKYGKSDSWWRAVLREVRQQSVSAGTAAVV